MKKKKKEYISETKEFKKIDLEEKDNIETIDELVLRERLKQRRKRINFIKGRFIQYKKHPRPSKK